VIRQDHNPRPPDPTLANWPEPHHLTRREWWGEVASSIIVVALVLLSAILLMAILSE